MELCFLLYKRDKVHADSDSKVKLCTCLLVTYPGATQTPFFLALLGVGNEGKVVVWWSRQYVSKGLGM